MIFTGKAKEQFEQWYLKQKYRLLSAHDFGDRSIIRHFNAMDISFKWGVYEKFADSLELPIHIKKVENTGFIGCSQGLAMYSNDRDSTRIELLININNIINDENN